EAWKMAFADRTKKDPATRRSEVDLNPNANEKDSTSLPNDYIHAFGNGIAMDEHGDWTQFESTSFEQRTKLSKSDSRSMRSKQSKQKKAPVYSSSDNKSNKSKPRKFFQKLLRNESNPAPRDDSDITGSGSMTDSNGDKRTVESRAGSDSRESWENFRNNVYTDPSSSGYETEGKKIVSYRQSYESYEMQNKQEMAQLTGTGDAVIYSRKGSSRSKKVVKMHEQRREISSNDDSHIHENQQWKDASSTNHQKADPIFQSSLAFHEDPDLDTQPSHVSQQHSRSQQSHSRQSVASDVADVMALGQFRERRDSMEPAVPIQRGNVEMKKKMLELNQANGDGGKGLDLFGSDNYEALNVFLQAYDHDEMTERDTQRLPPTPSGLDRPDTSGAFQPRNRQHQQKQKYGDLEIKESSSTLSNLLKVDTASTDDDDIGLNSPSEVDWPSNRNERSQHSSKPYSQDNVDAIEADEAEIRAAARQNGIPSPVIEILIRQSREANNRDPRVAQALTGIAKYDSDTGRPASTRHLHPSPHQPLSFNTGRTWDAVDAEKCEWPTTEVKQALQESPCARLEDQVAYDFSRPDPTPVAGSSAVSRRAMASAQMGGHHMDAPTSQGLHFQEGSQGPSGEDLTLLNRFIEVSSGNFGGNKLSAESESRVRTAALKIGLTPKFVDQLLKQQEQDAPDPFTYVASTPQGIHPPPPSQHQYPAQTQYNPHFQAGASPAPYVYGGDPYVGETSTYYSADMTRETRRTKKTEASDDGCNVWDTWEAMRTNLGFALAKVCATTTNGDDESSISSRGSLEEKKKRRRASKRHRKSRQSTGERGRRRESNYYNEPLETYPQEAEMPTQVENDVGDHQVGSSTPQSIRGY
ncbi:MAG: hypothetical protein SGILL_009380, partial [Bacillariaceae sp.]